MNLMNLRRSNLLRVLAAALLAVTLGLVVIAVPAHADHQNCGAKYPDGTLSNGHPDLTASATPGWSGQVALNENEAALFAVTSIKDSLLDGANVAGAVAEIIHERKLEALRALDSVPENAADLILTNAELVARIVSLGMVMAAVGMLIAETALMAAQRALAGAVGGENACNAVLAGDMLDNQWIATVERNLASDGPPLAMLLIPTDTKEPGGHSGEWPLQPQHEKGDFGWCPPIDLPSELPEPAPETNLDQANGPETGGDCTPTVPDGFLSEPYDEAPRVTVQAIVEDAIDHAAAHGLPVRDAKRYFDAAVAELVEGRYKEAYRKFRQAYQDAAGFDG